MVSPKDLVLITGATGHVGSCTLLHVLRAGYHVRAAVRSEAKAGAVLARPEIQSLKLGSRLTFIIVPDITLPGAYDDAVEDVTHIIHIASPLATADSVPLNQHEAYFIQPAVRGTINLLEAANLGGTVRRVVITSSFSALIPLAQLNGTTPCRRAISPNDRIPFTHGPYDSEFAAYAASKVAALQEAEAWLERERPAFDVVHLHPGFVLGRNDGATTAAEALHGTNGLVLALLLGTKAGPYPGAFVYAEDVARAHLMSLDPTVLGNQSYILSRPAKWNDAKEIVKREFADAVKTKLLVLGGSIETTDIPLDTTLSEETFGIKFASYRVQVKSIVNHYLELRMKRKASLPMAMAKARRASTKKPQEVCVSVAEITCG
ncbi:hypothetical protein B0T17DRAFT_512452 [Bombardia bombarda]|uniref:Ketoreductase domain-containing protein n=1 Tax=Bombardia bombarda TaxID=252184 RepID=A0AA39W9R7_9PEZI|nr:hypothetical protein B0T17DRAFT_512452 [Bombardia bombarda]